MTAHLLELARLAAIFQAHTATADSLRAAASESPYATAERAQRYAEYYRASERRDAAGAELLKHARTAS